MIGRVRSNKFLQTFLGFEKTKNSAHIVLIVLIHATGWCLFFLLPLFFYPVRINDDRFIYHELVDKAVLILFFYLNYYFFIPRLFEKKKYLTYFSVVVLAFIIYLGQLVFIRANYFPRPGGAFQFIQSIPSEPVPPSMMARPVSTNENRGGGVAIGRDSSRFERSFARPRPVNDSMPRLLARFRMQEAGMLGIPKGVWLMTTNNAVSSFALLLLMGGFIRLAYSFIRNQNEKKALENANLNAEINFLKSQINPHFLFNTLNSIYSQAHARSHNTEFSILKLSGLLRYVLYDSGDDKVALAKDIEYINNYIDLQRLRLSQKVSINYVVTGDMEGKLIAPLLLINFIENAFKHGISYSQASAININIVIFEKTLTLTVVNPMIETDSFAPGGLGLKNVIRRLELLYADHHHLDIHHNNSRHIVNLKLELTHA
jgi:two-component system, LytTR family, sensor kinase